jgi:hypothetical protein
VAGDSRVELEGQALDQGMHQLTGTSLQWLDGRVLLGTGNALSAGPLPPGLNHITLVARDAAGLIGTDSVTVMVTPVELPFLRLGVPPAVGGDVHTIVVRALSRASITLTIGGNTFALRAGVRRVLRISIGSGKGPVVLPLAAGFNGASIPFAVLVRRP